MEEIERDMREMGGRASGGHAPNSLVEVGGNDVLTEQGKYFTFIYNSATPN